MSVTIRSRRNLILSSTSAISALLMIGTGAYAQDKSTPIILGPVTVNDNTDKNALNHTPPVSTMPSESVLDTPQAVTVIDAETMRQQGTTTLGEALRNVPGITIAIGEGGTLAGDQFKIRGFDAKDDVYLDGLRDFAAYTRDSFNYEEVQVLKGPSGLMFGRGTTGGAINVISKTPFIGDKYSATAEIGNGDHYRGVADLNYQLSDTTAVRLNFMLTDTGVVDRDVTHSSRWGIAPSVALGLGTDTVFTLSYIHQHTDAIPDYGLVVAQNPPGILAEPVSEHGVPRSNFTGFDSDRDRNDADIVTTKVTHVASDWLTLENDARVADYSRYFQYTTVDRCDITSATNFCANTIFSDHPKDALGGIGGGGPYRQRSWGAQDVFSATANFHIGGLRNELIAGADVSYQDADRTIYAYRLPTTDQFYYALNDHTAKRANIGISLYNPTHQQPPGYTVFLPNADNIANSSVTSPTTVVYSSGDATEYALFVTDRLWFTDTLSVIAGGRFDKYDAHYRTTDVSGGVTTMKAPSSLFNPRASLVYEPTPEQNFYFTWGKSATPIGTSVVGTPNPLSATNQDLDPEKSESLELGAKQSLFDGALGLTGALFQVTKSNATSVDPVSGFVTLQSGQRQRVRGFETSATGNVTKDVTVTAAYTYLDPVVTRDLSCITTRFTQCVLNTFTIGKQITFVPKHGASLWTDYRAGELLQGLSFGGGVVYQSALYNAYSVKTNIDTETNTYSVTGLTRVVRIPETIELDAVVAYDIDRLHFQFNINNFADHLNYAQSFGNRGTPAPGRTFIFSVGTSF